MKKVIIAHASKQHSFHTAIALKRAGVLYKYITTVYDKPTSLTARAKNFLKGDTLKKANSRYCHELEDQEVLQFFELLGLMRIFIGRFKFLKFLNFDLFLMQIFAKKVIDYAVKENVDAIIVYDGLTKKYLDKLKKKAPHIKTIMDVTISSRPYMKDVFTKDMEKYNHEGFYVEERFLWIDKYFKNIFNDFNHTDYFFVPSKVVYDSLLFCGVDREKIIFIPYGVSIDQFQFVKKKRTEGALNLLFVGNLSYRKGIHHLLSIVSRYKKNEVSLSLAGGFNSIPELYNQYCNYDNINFLGFVTRDTISKVFQESDVFVIPTLGEGLCLVILEALATGTPVICTEMAGGNDAIVNYKNGIVSEANNIESFKYAIDWMLENRDKIPEMSEEARKTSLSYTWENYYSNLGNSINKILQ